MKSLNIIALIAIMATFAAMLLIFGSNISLFSPTTTTPPSTVSPSNSQPTMTPQPSNSDTAYPTVTPTQTATSQPEQSPVHETSPPLANPTPTGTQSSNPILEELVSYTLSLINSDRQSKGIQNVTLSNIQSGQQHANSMLVSGYFSHWDTQGYKPYMRYTLLGGKGSVSENVAYMWSTGTITDVKSALKKLEYGMMYDDASSNWGHRDNILDSFHNKVSIGIATNRTHVYLVQDFEDDYVNLSVTTSFGHVRINGTIHQSKPEISQIAIRFDNISDLTVQQLSNPPYDGSYASGAYVGMVVPPPEPGTEYIPPETGILVIATTWDQAGQNIDLTFDLSPAVSESGTGVYTLYLYTKANEHLTNYSLWYNG